MRYTIHTPQDTSNNSFLYVVYHILDIFTFQNTLFSAAGEAFSPVGCGGLYQGKPPEQNFI